VKRGTPEHWKMDQLRDAVRAKSGLPEDAAHTLACGMMVKLWALAARYSPRGDIGKMTDEFIARRVGWAWDARECVNALVAARWLDRDDTQRLVVHDWPTHCEDWVHMAVARARQYFADGSSPKLGRLPAAEKKALGAWYADRRPAQVAGTAEPELLPVTESSRESVMVGQSVRTDRAHGPCALPSLPLPSPTSPEPERESARAQRAQAQELEEAESPNELPLEQRQEVRTWAETYARSKLDRLLQLEQACLLWSRENGVRSSDWVQTVKLWILRQDSFDRAPPRARPDAETRATNRDHAARIEAAQERRRREREEWAREKAADPPRPETLAQFRPLRRGRRPDDISLDDYVDRKTA